MNGEEDGEASETVLAMEVGERVLLQAPVCSLPEKILHERDDSHGIRGD